MTSRNFRNSFRKVTIGNHEYLVWLNYKSDLFEKGKSLITVEKISNEIFDTTKICDIPFNGAVEISEKYAFYNKYKTQMESFAMDFHNTLHTN